MSSHRRRKRDIKNSRHVKFVFMSVLNPVLQPLCLIFSKNFSSPIYMESDIMLLNYFSDLEFIEEIV